MLKKDQVDKLQGLFKHYGELTEEQIEQFAEQEEVTIAEVKNAITQQAQSLP